MKTAYWQHLQNLILALLAFVTSLALAWLSKQFHLPTDVRNAAMFLPVVVYVMWVFTFRLPAKYGKEIASLSPGKRGLVMLTFFVSLFLTMFLMRLLLFALADVVF